MVFSGKANIIISTSPSASCALVHPYEGVIIGAVGGCVCMFMPKAVNYFKIDDPVGAFAVHGMGGLWGILAVGIFVDIDENENMSNGQRGLLHGGGFYLLGVQLLLSVIIIAWTAVTTLLMLVPLKYTIGIRMDEVEEMLGSDFVEHGIDQDARQAMLSAPNQETHSQNGENVAVAVAVSTTVRRRSFFGGLRDAPSIRMEPSSPRKRVIEIEDRSDTGISTTSLSQAATDVGTLNG